MFEDLLINPWAVLGSAVLGMVIGMLWYSPFLFGKLWMKLSHISEQDMEQAKKGAARAKSYGGAFLNGLVMSFVLAFFLDRVGAYDVVEGLIVAVMLWLGFVATVLFSAVLWERKPFSLFLIHAVQTLVFLAAASVVLMLFQ
ncbi:MAG: hypothetical protein A3C47_02940 [Omnitrophica bacterium RIFCSPHIGHO2_02_FULL_51_18]|nr:MAG: hypothetical protein A3C47_02940 [Omnitrophica bacterium RIFCSPHIGHO2_02_FULL_51_18]